MRAAHGPINIVGLCNSTSCNSSAGAAARARPPQAQPRRRLPPRSRPPRARPPQRSWSALRARAHRPRRGRRPGCPRRGELERAWRRSAAVGRPRRRSAVSRRCRYARSRRVVGRRRHASSAADRRRRGAQPVTSRRRLHGTALLARPAALQGCATHCYASYVLSIRNGVPPPNMMVPPCRPRPPRQDSHYPRPSMQPTLAARHGGADRYRLCAWLCARAGAPARRALLPPALPERTAVARCQTRLELPRDPCVGAAAGARSSPHAE